MILLMQLEMLFFGVNIKSCIRYQGKVEDLDGVIGTCCKCAMTQCMDRCSSSLSSRLFMYTVPGAKEYHMAAFKPVIQKKMQDDTGIEDISDTDNKI